MKQKDQFITLWRTLCLTLLCALNIAAYPVATQTGETETLFFDVETEKFYTDEALTVEKIGLSNWSFTNRVLTLNGFTWETSAVIALQIVNGDLTIELAASSTNILKSTYNTISTNDSYGLGSRNKITIQGTGTLESTGGATIYSYGILSSRSIVINGARITAKGGNGSVSSIGMYGNEEIVINGGEVNATSDLKNNTYNYGIYSNNRIVVSDGTVYANGNNLGIFADIIIHGGVIETISNSKALKVWNKFECNSPSYTYWTNTTTVNPGGVGTNGIKTPFVNSDDYKYVKIDANYAQSIENIKNTNAPIAYVQDGTLYLKNIQAGKSWNVYSISGALIYSTIADSNEDEMKLPQRGVYVIVINEGTVKVVY